MSNERFHFISQPSEWTAPPEKYSFSSLKQIIECPRGWQLQNSKYDGLDRYPSRPNPAAVEGGIVHSLLEKLFRSLACHGMPIIGSEAFQKCISEVDINLTISRLIRDYEGRIALNPRGHGFQLRSSIQQLHNKVVQIFRDQYDKIRQNTPPSIIQSLDDGQKKQVTRDVTDNDLEALLSQKKVFTELKLEHKELPFIGIIDFIWFDDEDIKISDFKSGAYKHDHREQLLIYSLLIKSNLGRLPKEAFIVYPDKSERVEINEIIVDKAYYDLNNKISKASKELSMVPAKAIYNDNCQYCQVRQLCDQYWVSLSYDPHQVKKVGIVDLEVEVTGTHSNHGFVGRRNDCNNLNVVYETNVAKALPLITCGERLRIIGGKQREDEIEIMPWTEVFHL